MDTPDDKGRRTQAKVCSDPLEHPSPNKLSTIFSANCGIKHMHLCGGRGLCTSCRVEIMKGLDNLSKMETFERISLRGHFSFSGDVRLACQAKIQGPVTVKTIFPTVGRLDFNGP